MNKDFRLQVSFVDHPKTIKLNRKGALLNLLKLWTWAAMNRPEGKLTGMSIDDIEIVSGWQKEEGKFVDLLLEIGFLDCKKEIFSLHDWAEHNPYAIHSKARSEKAKKAAKAKWDKYNKQSNEHASSIDQAKLEDDSSNAPLPSPSPAPSPLPIKKAQTKTKKKTLMPEDFKVNKTGIEKCYKLNLNDEQIKIQVQECYEYYSLRNTKFTDWQLVFKKWLDSDFNKMVKSLNGGAIQKLPYQKPTTADAVVDAATQFLNNRSQNVRTKSNRGDH
jgi:hypothetical protein